MYEEHMLEDVWDTNLVPFSVKGKFEHKVHRSEMRNVVFCKVLNFFRVLGTLSSDTAYSFLCIETNLK
jgi:hypothetical protein